MVGIASAMTVSGVGRESGKVSGRETGMVGGRIVGGRARSGSTTIGSETVVFEAGALGFLPLRGIAGLGITPWQMWQALSL
jgi:hypothetical protein